MTVYVDCSVHSFGRMVMCHMVSPDEAELHTMASAIGVQRKWFQDPIAMPKVSRPHYDIAKGKRAAAIAAGALEVDRYQMVAVSNIALNRFRVARGIIVTVDPLRPLRAHWELPRIEAWLAEQGLSADLRWERA